MKGLNHRIEEWLQKDIVKKIIKVIKIIITIMLAISVFVLLDIFFLWCNNSAGYERYNIAFPILLSIILFSLFFGITKHTSKSLKILYILTFLVGSINLIKVSITLEPLYLSDINFIGKIGGLANMAFSNISTENAMQYLYSISGWGGILLVLWIISKITDIKLENAKVRVIMIVTNTVLLLVLFIPTSLTKNFYLNLFFKQDKVKDYASYGTNFHYYMYYGCTGGTYGVYLNNIFVEPEGYNEQEIEQDVKDMANNHKETKTLGKPNIIVVFSESFWDIDKLEEVEFNTKITSNFNNLKSKGKIIELIAPVYGGLSENTAFEFFTGANMSYFPNGYIPISALYNKKDSEEIPSLIRILKNSGYTSSAVFVEDYYKTEKAYRIMGVDDYRELKKINSKIKYTDEYMTDLIISDFEKKEGKILNFYSTYEGHMPYNIGRYKKYDISITKSKLPKKGNDTLLSYAQGVYNADKQLGRLYDYIQTVEEDTMIVFLSDHLPYLYNSDKVNIVDKLNYFNTDNFLLNYFRKYNTQALILSNFDMDDFNIPPILGVDCLFTYIVNNMDVKTIDYYKWLQNFSEEILASNKFLTVKGDGIIYHTPYITDDLKEKYEYRERVQYRYFMK